MVAVASKALRKQAVKAGLKYNTVRARYARGVRGKALLAPARSAERGRARLIQEVNELTRQKRGKPTLREFRERYGRMPAFQYHFGSWSRLLRIAARHRK